MSFVQRRTFSSSGPAQRRLIGRCNRGGLGHQDVLSRYRGHESFKAKTTFRRRATGDESGASDDDEELKLTVAERAMIEMDGIPDPDARVSNPISADFQDAATAAFSNDGDGQAVGREEEDLDWEYAERKAFIDYDALEKTKEFGKAMAIVADELKCRSIRLLDVHKKLHWTETFLILTAMSRTQMNAALGKMEKVALEEWGIPVVDAVTRRSEWESIDFGSLIVHVFSPRTREYYKLEELYSQCDEIEVPYGPKETSPRWQENLRK